MKTDVISGTNESCGLRECLFDRRMRSRAGDLRGQTQDHG